MNKKFKVLSSVICGLVLSSGIALTSVQAAPVQNNISGILTPNAIIPGQKYSCYAKINTDTHKQIEKYINKNGQSSTADGIRNILLSNGISKNIANNISFSLFELANKVYTDERAFPEIENWEIEVLTDGNGKYCLMSDRGSTQTVFSIYAILNHQDIVELEKVYDELINAGGGIYIPDYFANAMISKGIIDDPTIAKNVGEAIGEYIQYNWSGLAVINENLLILKSADGTTFLSTREAR